MEDMLTPEEVGKKIGLSETHVRLLIRQGRIKATQFGRIYLVAPGDAVKPEFKQRGRPVTKGKAKVKKRKAGK